jgi:hypothetical protein
LKNKFVLNRPSITSREKEKKLKKLGKILNVSTEKLSACTHDNDIRKTCRSIVKHLYPDIALQRKMSFSSLSRGETRAIRGEHTTKYFTNNHFWFFRICSTRPSPSI